MTGKTDMECFYLWLLSGVQFQGFPWFLTIYWEHFKGEAMF